MGRCLGLTISFITYWHLKGKRYLESGDQVASVSVTKLISGTSMQLSSFWTVSSNNEIAVASWMYFHLMNTASRLLSWSLDGVVSVEGVTGV